jgi:hypothetical protein
MKRESRHRKFLSPKVVLREKQNFKNIFIWGKKKRKYGKRCLLKSAFLEMALGKKNLNMKDSLGQWATFQQCNTF